MGNRPYSEKTVIIYDTFCGWCYGAAPLFDAIVDADPDVEVLHRHLFQGKSSPRMSEGKGSQILQTIPQLEALTGQSFSTAFKTNIAQSQTEVLVSGLSAQAAALVHDQGAKKEFSIRRRLETLHFGQGVSSTDRQAIVAALIDDGISPEEADRIGTPGLEAEAAKLTDKAKSLMAAVGSQRVPTILKVRGDQVTRIDHQTYYGRPEAVTRDLGAAATQSF